MKKYLFLLAWVEGSPSAAGEKTKVKSQLDLVPQYKKNNQHIFALCITAPNENLAASFGYERAFFEGYYAEDSVSTTELIGAKVRCHKQTPMYVVDCSPE